MKTPQKRWLKQVIFHFSIILNKKVIKMNNFNKYLSQIKKCFDLSAVKKGNRFCKGIKMKIFLEKLRKKNLSRTNENTNTDKYFFVALSRFDLYLKTLQSFFLLFMKLFQKSFCNFVFFSIQIFKTN